MASATKNFEIRQGETFKHTLTLKHGCMLARDLKSSPQSPITSIAIAPLPIDIPAGFKLQFPSIGCNTVDVVTSAIVPAGSVTAPIVPYAEKANVPCGTMAPTLPQDLTGEIWRGSCRKKYDDPAPVFNFTFAIAPLLGQVVVTVADTVTSGLNLPSRELVIFSDLPTDIQQERNFKPEIWAKAWFYDFERVFPNGEVNRELQGRLWLVAEATK